MSIEVLYTTKCNYCGCEKQAYPGVLVAEEGWKRDEHEVNGGHICPECQKTNQRYLAWREYRRMLK